MIFFKINRAVNEGRLDWLTNVYDSSCLRGGKLSGLRSLRELACQAKPLGDEWFSDVFKRTDQLFLFRWTDLSH